MGETVESGVDLHDAITPHLPYLRRFARAVTGSQSSGDAYTAATLEAIIADDDAFDGSLPPRVALFKAFDRVWSSIADKDAAGASDGSEMEEAARQRLERLTPRSREVLLLTALEEFSIGEVASIVGVPTAEVDMLRQSALADIAKQTAARILIIEDEPIIAIDIESIVLELGHRSVGIADTRDQAVQMAQDEKPDLILSDIQLADGSSGVDAAHDILSEFDVPIIFITAFPERLLTGDRPEPTFLITKPFKREAVQAAVSQALFFGTAAGIEV